MPISHFEKFWTFILSLKSSPLANYAPLKVFHGSPAIDSKTKFNNSRISRIVNSDLLERRFILDLILAFYWNAAQRLQDLSNGWHWASRTSVKDGHALPNIKKKVKQIFDLTWIFFFPIFLFFLFLFFCKKRRAKSTLSFSITKSQKNAGCNAKIGSWL